MLNHVRTLLLNESHTADGAPEWCVDGAFSKMSLKGSLASLYDVLFSGAESVPEKAARVNEIVPFVFAPEFSSYIGGLDPRVTVDTFLSVSKRSVSDFYRTITGGDFSFVPACLSSFSSTTVFQHVGDVDLDSALDELYEIRTKSHETAKQFSACVVAAVLLLDLEYRKTQGRRT